MAGVVLGTLMLALGVAISFLDPISGLLLIVVGGIASVVIIWIDLS